MNRRALRHRALGATLSVAVAAGIAGCGGSDPPPPPAASTPEPVSHIHGLSVNPADESLVIATHSGLFRVGAGETVPRRIGDRRQDTMGFTIVGPDRFLGSGHPDPREDLPPMLGLIRSQNGGHDWKPVSLLGDADFHVLRAAAERIYGVNSADGRLLVSDDGGQEWAVAAPPAPLIDLAIHPGEPDRIVASAEPMLFTSGNAGRSWQPLKVPNTGLLAWPSAHALYLIDSAGSVHRSRNAGRTWRAVGQVGGRPAAVSAHGRALFVALHDNTIEVSIDGGRNWAVRSTG